MSTGSYTGTDNLEVMEVAVNYRRYLTGLVTQVLGPDGRSRRLLDFGAGVGTQALALRSLGYDVTCVELDDTLRRRLSDMGFASAATVEELKGQVFDLAYTMNVLEHIHDDVGALRGVRDVVVPGGELVVYVPAFEVLYTAMDRKVGHVRRYRRAQLVRTVTAAGFDVRRVAYADSLGFLAALAYRVAGNRRGDLDERAVAVYDRFVFPPSRMLDRVTWPAFGKNLVLVARRREDGA